MTEIDTEMEFLRQEDLIPPDRIQALKVEIIGCGSVGSFTALGLIKMGVRRLVVSDPDEVLPHNLPNQVFDLRHLDMKKVTAMVEIGRVHGMEVWPIPAEWTPELRGNDVLIVAVDSIEVRKAIFAQLLSPSYVFPKLFVDARMGAEVGVIYTVSEDRIDRYTNTLHPSEEVHHAPCTARSTGYCAMGLGAYVCSAIRKFVIDEPIPFEFQVDFRNWLSFKPKEKA